MPPLLAASLKKGKAGETFALPLQGLYIRCRGQQFENLLDVYLDAIAGKGIITKYHPQWFVGVQLLDQFLVDAGIETGNQGRGVYLEDAETGAYIPCLIA